ncbi:MAG TPA: hypothetical protein VEB63_10605 [Chitinophagaceae bacterium]|nr:hypothetical protein [Chitinophagaceae bacterium]
MPKIWILDEAAAPLINYQLWTGIGFMLAAILLEAGLMRWMKYALRFGKALLDSFLANIASLALGFLLIRVGTLFTTFTTGTLLLFYFITVAVETAVLYMLNRDKLFTRTLVTAMIINLASYIVLVILLRYV